MADHLHEEEQLQAIKDWWNERGKQTVIFAVLVVALIFGGRTWLSNREKAIETASFYYEALLANMQANEMDAAKSQAQNLVNNYSRTTYASFASLLLAKMSMEENNLDDAKAHLSWVMENSRHDTFIELARLRLARVQIAAGSPDDALSTLEDAKTEEYEALMEEVKGDAYAALNELDKARTFYQVASTKLGPDSSSHLLLKMKIDSLTTVQ